MAVPAAPSDRAYRLPWIEPIPCEVNEACLTACGGDIFLAQILLRRGYVRPDRIRAFLSPELYAPSPPEQLPDLVNASTLLKDITARRGKILVWGDFDVDGQTSTALLVDGLERLGADVSYFIPDRSAESHGIKVDSLQRELAKYHPDVLVTCDTGISEFEAIDYAASIGLPVIVTDHHAPTDKLPNASAVINPCRLRAGHPLTSLPGVGVAYKLMQHLYTSLGRERELSRLLDLVALGIVGDIATQTDDTRYLLQMGLERLRRTERIGLQALIEVANLTQTALTGERIAYQIGPRLNAAGRLADAALAVELLTTHNSSRARVLAQQLEGLNNERRTLTRQIEAAAEALIAESSTLLESEALVLYQPEWHPGVIGIVAAHLSDRYARPVVMLAGGLNSGIARGSVRAPRGYDVNNALSAHADLLRTYGGHAGAAGLSLEVHHIERFREQFSRTLAATGAATSLALKVDAIATFDALSLDLANRIQRLAPFGEGNPSVVVATMNVRLSHAAKIGRDAQHRRLTVEDDQGRQQIILWWHSAADALPEGHFDIAYNIVVTDRQELQLTMVDFRQREDSLEVKPVLHIEDWRTDAHPLARLQSLLDSARDCLVWAEAESRRDHPQWKRRAELVPSRNLIIYTVPPDPQTLRKAIEVVQPDMIYLIAAWPPVANREAFLTQLERATRNVIEQYEGKTELDILCGATAASPHMVRAGLDYLVAEGRLGGLTWTSKVRIRLMAEPQTPLVSRDIALSRLDHAYQEAEAYRRFIRNAPTENLM
jgi:single-stranded-DNA-specific exonuclease